MNTLEQLQREWELLAHKYRSLLTKYTHFEAFYRTNRSPRVKICDNRTRNDKKKFYVQFSDGTIIPRENESFVGARVLVDFIKKVGIEAILNSQNPNSHKSLLTKNTKLKKQHQLKAIDRDWWVITKMDNPNKYKCIQDIIGALGCDADIKSVQ